MALATALTTLNAQKISGLVLQPNGQPVEFGEPLFIIETA